MNISEGATYKTNRDDYECVEPSLTAKGLITCQRTSRKHGDRVWEVTVCNEDLQQRARSDRGDCLV